MMDPHYNQSAPQSLARLLDAETGGGDWTAEEMAAILRHQLAAPLRADLTATNPRAGKTLDTVSQAGPPPATFGELFAHPRPPLELLELAKDFGKALRRDAACGVPAGVATVIYYASIVAARLRCGRRISDLDETALRRGVEWALAQPWLDEATRAMFEEARRG
jgi:hypothetical protein